MTLSSSVNKSGPYTGNGATTVFARTFLVTKAEHLRVYQTDSDNVVSEVTTGITKDGIGSASGNVTFSTAPATGVKITLIRDVPILQETDYSDQGRVSPVQVENDLDLAIMISQDLAEKQGRVPSLSVSYTGADVVFSDPVDGKFLRWSGSNLIAADGDPYDPANFVATGGTIDGVVIGASSAAAATFSDLTVSDAGNVITYVTSSDNQATQMRLRSDSENRRVIAEDSGGAVVAQMSLENTQIVFGGSSIDEDVARYALMNRTGIHDMADLVFWGANRLGAADVAADVSDWLDAALANNLKGVAGGSFRLDSLVTFNMSGTFPGDNIALEGGGMNSQTWMVNNATGGLLFNGTGVGRQHTVQLGNMQFEPVLANSGYPFKIVGTAGGVSLQNAVVLDNILVGQRNEEGAGNFGEGPSILGLFHPKIKNLRIFQPHTSVNKWPHALDLSGCYFPVVDVFINVSSNLPTGGGADIGIKLHGTTEEAFAILAGSVSNGADVGLSIENTGREPNGKVSMHINAGEIGARINGVKRADFRDCEILSDHVPGGTDFIDFLVEDAEHITFEGNKFRQAGNNKRHFWLEPKSGKAGAKVAGIKIVVTKADLAAITPVAPIYLNGATDVEIHIPRETSTTDGASYPETLIEYGPNQDQQEVTIVVNGGASTVHKTTAASFTPRLQDQGGIVDMASTSANTFNLPLNVNTPYKNGAEIGVVSTAGGVTTVQAPAGMTLNGVAGGSCTLTGTKPYATIRKIGVLEWNIQGDHGAIS